MLYKVRTQVELDAAVAKFQDGDEIECRGPYFEVRDSSQVTAYGSSQVRAYGSSQVTAYGSSQVRAYGSSQVRAYGSSQVRAYGSSQVTAYGSSQVRAYGSSQVTAYGSSQVTACDSSQVRACDSSQVTAYGSSQVRACDSSQVTACDSSQVRACDSSQVRAYGSSQVRAYGSSQVRATKQVPVTKHGTGTKVTGGVQIDYASPSSVQEWCDNYGVDIIDGAVVLYKGVNDSWTTPRKTDYTPGTIPVASDWDGGKEECGGGLHFSPWPAMTLYFHAEATKFLACPIKIEDIVVHEDATYPDKVKARGCYAPVWEVDIHGNKK